jgi:protein-tyrosine phosphatase
MVMFDRLIAVRMRVGCSRGNGPRPKKQPVPEPHALTTQPIVGEEGFTGGNTMATVRVLFVCMGNICRSPAAECVFREKARQRGLDGRIKIDSAGTTGYHSGEPPDSRMSQTGRRRGYRIEGSARQVCREDLDDFDMIIAMDRANLRELYRMDKEEKYRDKLYLFLDFHPEPPFKEVPDPYYGGPEGFDKVLDLVEGASDGLLDMLTRESP